MERDMIVLNDFCVNHQIDVSFVQSLEEYGLVEIVIADQPCVHVNELPRLERMVRLHRELNVNPEGIDVIDQLLKRMEDMRQEINDLRNRLDFYTQEK